MSYTDKKITQEEINAHHVQGATDYLIGNPQQNKAVFDNLPEFIAGKFNDLIDEIAGQHGDEIREAVDEWLAEHPEVTTTVQDNSLTTAKYVDGSVTEPKIAEGAVTPSRLDRAYSTPADLASVNANLTNELNVLDSRMDEFASLPEGSTTADAELIDIRVGADGKTYPSAGDAVRGQVADLKSDLDMVYDGEYVRSVSGKDIEVYIPINPTDFETSFTVAHTSITYTSGVTSFFVGQYDSNRSQIRQDERKYGDQSASSATYSLVNGTAYVRIVYHSTSTGSITLAGNRKQSIDLLQSEIDSIENNVLVPCELKESLDLSGGTTGYFITALGVKTSNADFKISDTFAIKKGWSVGLQATGYLTNVAMISMVNDDNSYTPLVISTSSSNSLYEYKATEDVNVVFSFNKNSINYANTYYLVVTNDDELKSVVDSLKSGFLTLGWEKTGTLVDSKQVQVSGGSISIANGTSAYKYAVQDVSNISKVKVTCHAGMDTSYGVGYIFATDAGVVVSQYNNSYGEYTLEVDVPTGATKLYVNNNGISAVTPTILKAIDVPNHPYFDLSLFQKFGVVGDSYASGELYYNGAYTDKYNISWGQILARKHGITCTNYSKGGLSTRSWLTDGKGLPLMLSSPAEDLYILALGINDYYQEGQAYLGDITDITSHQSYEDYGDTFYGNYGRIIEQIQTHAPHAKIIMSTVANTNTVPQMFSDAIIEIAEHYNIPYIVQASDSFFQSTMYTTMSGGHPIAVTYSGMALAFERLIDKCVKDNLSYFFNTFMYN